MTADVTLRKWSLEDAPALAVMMNNRQVQDNLRDGIPYPYTEADARAFLQGVLDAVAGTQYAFAVLFGGELVGSAAVFRKDNVHRLTGELGYYIAEPHWGKGVMTAAVRQICAYVFMETDIVRIFAEPYAFNDASCRVLEKAGFQLEGVLRQNAVKQGQVVDMKLYALLRRDWEA